MAGGKGHEVVVLAGIASGMGCYGAEGARFGIIRCTVIDLYIGAKFQGHSAVVGFGCPDNDGSGRHGGTDTIRVRKHV